MKKSGEPHFERVLLIDDEEIDNLINERLIQVNYFAKHVTVKTNIPSALNYLYMLLDKGEPVPEVIFLDLNLPGYNGFHFLLEFKQMLYKYEELKNSHIIILSAFLGKFSDMITGNHAFVTDRVTKPLSEDTLNNLAEKIKSTLGIAV